ncbi:uncharacterized protein LOC142557029 isoform X1 [Dermacentor variabilis]|uniref:uncharacterized protein LOC142557029 isoform X1 n=1 Tax=Dermacentor variabilis TaxID=34621 RepID=UPI003F5BD001
MHCRKMILKLLGKGVKPSPSVVLAEWSPVGSKAASSQSSSDDSGDEGTGTSGAGQSELLTFVSVSTSKAIEETSQARHGRLCCWLCPYNAAYTSQLAEHMRTHTAIVSRSLHGSGIPSHSSSGATSDIVGAERSEAGRPDLLTSTSPLASPSVQETPSRTHKQHHCALCSYKAISNSKLTLHMRSHTGEKPFKCHLCPSAFVQGSDCRRHMSVHTGVKHFKCHLCPYSAVQKSDLKIHNITHTGKKPYQCNQCSYASTRSARMRRHMLQQHK